MRTMPIVLLLGLAACALTASVGISGAAAQERAGGEVAREGRVSGTVVTAGEERLVVQKTESGQMTLEPRWLGNGQGRDKEQIAFFRTLAQGDRIEASWKLDEGTHFCVLAISKLGPDGKPVSGIEAREGRLKGTVVTATEERVVVQQAEGGQMTVEPRWVQKQGQWSRDQDVIARFRTLKQGDPINGWWRKGDGNHFVLWAFLTPDGAPERPTREAPSASSELAALRDEISALRREVAALREMLSAALNQQK